MPPNRAIYGLSTASVYGPNFAALFRPSPNRARQHRQDIPLAKEGQAISVIIAGGGTGGHLFPGIAIADEILAADPDNSILFIGTGNPFETTVLNQKGFSHQRIDVEGIKGRGILNQMKAICSLPQSMMQSLSILRTFRPDLVLGVGGYSAGPVAMSAWLLGIRIVLHEQNVLPGITNRVLARFADRIYISFKETRLKAASRKLHLTGNPVRKEILTSQDKTARIEVDADSDRAFFNILIVGGSQGAHRINTAMVEALASLKDKKKYVFVHQTGAADENRVKQAYQDDGRASTVQAFFNDMDRRYRQADLVICRAGATTVAELTVLGKPVIFVPYPYAADDHQVLNAHELVSAGAAEMILQKDLTGKLLAQKIEYYADSPQVLALMASNAKHLGRPNAARDIVADIYNLVGK